MKFFLSNPSSLNDDELLAKYQGTSDLDFLAELFSRYSHLIYGVCLKYMQDQELAKDVSMEIFDLLQEKIPGTEINNFGAWLYVLVKNKCLMSLRKQSKQDEKEKESVLFMESEQIEHHVVEIDYEVSERILRNCLDKLSSEQKKCIRLFYYEEKCYKQVANLTGFTLKKVKSYLQNGKRNLKNCIEHNREAA